MKRFGYVLAFAIMFWLPTAAHAQCCLPHPWNVVGAIADKYYQLGGPDGLLGPAKSAEQPASNGGRFQEFANGVIYWHPDPSVGAHEVHGAILDLWTSLGRTTFGYPITDETAAPDGRGRFNDFRLVQLLPNKEDRSIYWTATTQAHSVIGAIRNKWAQWESQRGKLGYPISEEMADGNGRKSYFEYGFIRWTPPAAAGQDTALVTTYDHSPETMTDRCSAEVAFPPVYGGQPTNIGTLILNRGVDGYSDWTPIFTAGLDDGGQVRWFCHSTTGNFVDPGTWRLRDTGVACMFGGSPGGGGGGGGGGSSSETSVSLSSSVTCSTTVNFNSDDASGWTAERSRCNDHTNMFRARLGPDRLLEILCVESINSSGR